MSPAQVNARAAVASCALAAAHRRDHQHSPDDACMPHCIEVVHLGRGAAAMVCHDCGTDTGFIDPLDAESAGRDHVTQTRARAA